MHSQYNSIQEKVDIIVGAVTNFIKTFQDTVPKFESKATEVKDQFAKFVELPADLKNVVSKPAQHSLLTPEFLTQKLNVLDQVI